MERDRATLEYEIQAFGTDLKKITDHIDFKTTTCIDESIDLTAQSEKLVKRIEQIPDEHAKEKFMKDVSKLKEIVLSQYHDKFKVFESFFLNTLTVKPHILLPEDRCQIVQYTPEDVTATEKRIAELEQRLKDNRAKIACRKRELEIYNNSVQNKLEKLDQVLEARKNWKPFLETSKQFYDATEAFVDSVARKKC